MCTIGQIIREKRLLNGQLFVDGKKEYRVFGN